jgi:hypothetical protein
VAGGSIKEEEEEYLCTNAVYNKCSIAYLLHGVTQLVPLYGTGLFHYVFLALDHSIRIKNSLLQI